MVPKWSPKREGKIEEVACPSTSVLQNRALRL